MYLRIKLVGPVVAVVLVSGCVIPTVSTHSTRDVLVSVSEVESGKPVGRAPVSVGYYYDMLTPLYLHYEFRTPPSVRSETDQAGRVVIPMADYSGRIVLNVETTNWWARFDIDKHIVRDGGALEQRHKGRTIRLRLDPIKEGANPQGGANGRQPVSETNWTSAAAASRRSP